MNSLVSENKKDEQRETKQKQINIQRKFVFGQEQSDTAAFGVYRRKSNWILCLHIITVAQWKG